MSDVQALIFDCDGVLADTERDGHLVAFNLMFQELGLPFYWDDAEYAHLVRIGGGKERLKSVVTDAVVARYAEPGESADDMVARWHQVKSRYFQDLVRAGKISARPGIKRLINEALAAGLKVAVASTSAEASVRAVLESAVGEGVATRVRIFAGDIVKRKKPAPDIYFEALRGLGVSANFAVAVEDSGQGCAAAAGAQIPVIVTVSSFTGGDDFTGAAAVVSDLGEPNEPLTVVADPDGVMAGVIAVDVGVIRALGKANRN